MASTKPEIGISAQRLDRLCWFVERYDDRRASVSNRAAIVLSADALLIAGVTFIMDKARPEVTQYSHLERVVLLVCFGTSILLLICSITLAIAGLANVWRTSKQMFGSEMPERIFFYPRQTFEACKNYSEFDEHFRTSSEEEMTRYALGHMWVTMCEYHSRYQNLRRASRLLMLSIIPFTISILVFLTEFAR